MSGFLTKLVSANGALDIVIGVLGFVNSKRLQAVQQSLGSTMTSPITNRLASWFLICIGFMRLQLHFFKTDKSAYWNAFVSYVAEATWMFSETVKGTTSNPMTSVILYALAYFTYKDVQQIKAQKQ